MGDAQSAPSPEVAPIRRHKQAVLVIHGIGSQRPMETLASFVEQTWLKDKTGANRPGRRIWYRPDTGSRNFDLFQIVADDRDGVRTDFFELYWAHLMEGTRFASVWSWFWHDLVLRRRADMPKPMAEAKTWVVAILAVVVLVLATAFALSGTWLLLASWLPRGVAHGMVVAAFVAAMVLFKAGWKLIPIFPAALVLAYAVFGIAALAPLPGWAVAVALGAAALLVGALAVLERSLVSPYIGDAARYLRNTPENIAARQEIRALGVAALARLHDPSRGYDRIVVVGHSLGSIIGYDILRYLFAERTHDMKLDADPPPAVVTAFDATAGTPGAPGFMAAQRALCRELGGGADRRWLVSDFVTLGSPLAYANILLARSDEEFRTRVSRRMTPVCPPQQDSVSNEVGVRGFYRWRDRATGREHLTPHHGGVFAFTRWVNLYFPASQVIFGDIIGGPVAGAGLMGAGVKDVALDCDHLFGRQIFSHTSYWSLGGDRGTPAHIEAVQLALDLEDKGTAAELPACTNAARGGRRLVRRLPPAGPVPPSWPVPPSGAAPASTGQPAGSATR